MFLSDSYACCRLAVQIVWFCKNGVKKITIKKKPPAWAGGFWDFYFSFGTTNPSFRQFGRKAIKIKPERGYV